VHNTVMKYQHEKRGNVVHEGILQPKIPIIHSARKTK
jgi:hypothetical protein